VGQHGHTVAQIRLHKRGHDRAGLEEERVVANLAQLHQNVHHAHHVSGRQLVPGAVDLGQIMQPE